MDFKRTYVSIFIVLSVVKMTCSFSAPELTLTAKVGSRMILPCRLPLGTSETLVQWYMGSKQLTMGTYVLQYRSRLELNQLAPNEINLIIKSVVRSDENEFTCRTHVHDQIFSRIHVQVEWKPEIVEQESSKTQEVMVEGSTGQLKCAASGQPKPNVTWHRRSQEERTFTPIGVTGDVLTIHNITRYGSDVFMCNASNAQGYATWEMNVTVHFPVQVFINGSDMAIEKGEGALMTCVIQGSPLYTYYWKFNGNKIGDNWKYMIRTDHDVGYPVYFLTLMIRPKTLGEYDFGVYTCHADGLGMEAEDTIMLTEKKEDANNGGVRYNVIG